MSTYRCDKCGFASFKTEQSFQGHLLTKKHLMRQETVREDLFQCKTCNKWYCGRSGISHHNKPCSSKKLNPNPVMTEQPGATKIRQPEREQSEKLELNVQDARIDKMQQEINDMKKEIRIIKKEKKVVIVRENQQSQKAETLEEK